MQFGQGASMKKFRYRAKKGPKETVEGVLVAENRDEVINQINDMGLFPIEIDEERLAEKAAKDLLKLPARAVGNRERTVFYGQLSRLIKSGVPILRSLNIIREQTSNERFREVINQVQRGVKEGGSLSASLGSYPKIFLPFEVAMIQTGESVGKLGESLARLVDYLEEQEALRSKVRTAVAYPIFMTAMGAITVFVMVTFVVPKFSQFFSDLGQELPIATRLLIRVSHVSNKAWPWGAAILGALLLWMKNMSRTPTEKRVLDRFVLGIPKIGQLVMKLETARFARALELLIGSGMQILNAVRIAIPVIGNEALKGELEKCSRKLEEGGFLSDGLRQSKLFPAFVCHLVSIGEESGKLDEAFREIAAWYEKDTTQTIQIFTNLLEPAIIVGVGFVLGLIIVAVLMPVFSINSMVQ